MDLAGGHFRFSQGDVVGTFGDANFNVRGFLLKNGRFTTIDVPGTSCGPDCFFGTFANGNPQGDIVEYYVAADSLVHGFSCEEVVLEPNDDIPLKCKLPAASTETHEPKRDSPRSDWWKALIWSDPSRLLRSRLGRS